MKHARQAKILEIIDKEVIETQEEIADRLKKPVWKLPRLQYQGI